MTDAAILQMYAELADSQSTLSQVLQVQLANNAKNRLESELRLEATKALDTSLTAIVGGTYVTPYPLMADWFLPNHTIYVGQDPYRQIPMERRELFRGNTGFFYVDARKRQLYLCGTQQQAQTISVPYFVATPDMTTATAQDGVTATVTWPDRFHPLLAFEMAQLYYAVDAGDKNRAWDDRWQAVYRDLRSALVAWDQQLKLAANAGSTPYGSETEHVSMENKINSM
jgi:hypothetical protein